MKVSLIYLSRLFRYWTFLLGLENINLWRKFCFCSLQTNSIEGDDKIWDYTLDFELWTLIGQMSPEVRPGLLPFTLEKQKDNKIPLLRFKIEQSWKVQTKRTKTNNKFSESDFIWHQVGCRISKICFYTHWDHYSIFRGNGDLIWTFQLFSIPLCHKKSQRKCLLVPNL